MPQPDQMDRVRAAREFFDRRGLMQPSEEEEMAAFMAIFHPEHPLTAELIELAARSGD